MAQLRARDRLQPALLDRLTDDEPLSQVESSESRVIGRSQLREMVLRDLAWLFNASSPSAHIDWLGAEQARKSVLSFGLPPLSGSSVSNVDLLQLQQNVRQAILDHEPRILPETLVVEAVVSAQQLDHHNQIGFRIAGQLWAQPVPLELLLKTDIDLETGRVAVRELDR
ncbi:type VI secretion system baseplate subunit TssE [Paucibacter aquatile]|uniref:Type VI secretion system baseplate subunit TssE n=1 Tax=Kinneretia aquatilis TaxID=2070761 RepID=A0A2N8KTJ1_9BURK|nr:type VI secretion system baseplate subunit TssE [Paucibacter aquatile]PND36732.1 type VI secretion system baseplate subunit TssE [Paucibacter aquatile]WIV95776.1 type VI secretion system baseplate subunit TssE [Paucibacter aquatile]